MRVLGIDPGLRSMGWGVIEVSGSRLTHVANGQCAGGSGDLGDRLLRLFDQLGAVIAAHTPDAAAVEQTFVNKDAAGTLKLGQARGVAILCTITPRLEGRSFGTNVMEAALTAIGDKSRPLAETELEQMLQVDDLAPTVVSF